jgi:hypothetical protein
MIDTNFGMARRLLLKGALAGVGVFGLGWRAAFAGKVSQGSVGYQPSPNGEKNCAGCGLFVSPSGCRSVAGTISANGWCRLWKAA